MGGGEGGEVGGVGGKMGEWAECVKKWTERVEEGWRSG